MLIKEEHLQPQFNILEQLDQAVYLTQEEAEVKVEEIPLVEHNGSYLFDHDYYFDRFIEEGHTPPSYKKLAEANNIDYTKIVPVISEESVIINPPYSLAGTLVTPIKESSLEYQYVSECIDKWSTTSNDKYLDAIVEDTYLNEFVDEIKDFYTRDFRRANMAKSYAKARLDDNIKNIADSRKELSDHNKTLKDENATDAAKTFAKSEIDRIKDEQHQDAQALRGHESDMIRGYSKGAGKILGTGLAVYGGYKGVQKLVQMAKDRPKSWIGKKIASLRKIYSKWMNAAKRTSDKSNSTIIKNAAQKILTVIDKLLAILQKNAG